MTQPVIDFRDPNSPTSPLASLTLMGSGAGGAIVAGTTSTTSTIRIYNNYAKTNGISDALNCVLAAYDGAAAQYQGSALTLPVSQTWLQVSVADFCGSTTNGDYDLANNSVYYPLGGSQKHAFSINGGSVNGSSLANPSVAPVPSAIAGPTALLAGTYTIGYTYANGTAGETLLSPTANVTITAGQAILLAAITLPSGATAAKLYMSIAAGSSTLNYVASSNGAATTLSALPTSGTVPPVLNTTLPFYMTLFVRMAVPAGATLTAVTEGLWLEYSWI